MNSGGLPKVRLTARRALTDGWSGRALLTSRARLNDSNARPAGHAVQQFLADSLQPYARDFMNNPGWIAHRARTNPEAEINGFRPLKLNVSRNPDVTASPRH